MPVFIAMLRGVNVGGHNKIKMDALRELCESLKLRDAVTHLQSGNVAFQCAAVDATDVARRLEKAIERTFGFHSDVIVRTPGELQDAISRSPFATRGLHPGKILVYFMASEPSAEGRAKLATIQADPEEMHIHPRELFIYFPNGMGRPNLSMAAVDRAVQTPGTGRNWNTLTKLLEIAKSLNRPR